MSGHRLEDLSDDGKQQLAMALLLLKDFKADGKFDVETVLMILELADMLGVRKQYDDLVAQVPPLRITQRY